MEAVEILWAVPPKRDFDAGNEDVLTSLSATWVLPHLPWALLLR
jgi:hypothetical protein